MPKIRLSSEIDIYFKQTSSEKSAIANGKNPHKRVKSASASPDKISKSDSKTEKSRSKSAEQRNHRHPYLSIIPEGTTNGLSESSDDNSSIVSRSKNSNTLRENSRSKSRNPRHSNLLIIPESHPNRISESSDGTNSILSRSKSRHCRKCGDVYERDHEHREHRRHSRDHNGTNKHRHRNSVDRLVNKYGTLYDVRWFGGLSLLGWYTGNRKKNFSSLFPGVQRFTHSYFIPSALTLTAIGPSIWDTKINL